MWRYDDSACGVADALRLARAMTYKAACAGLPLGGGKGVIMLRDGAPQGHARRDVLLDFGETVDALDGAYITAEDVGTSSRDMTVIAEATRHVSGLAQARGGSGDPSPYTALGVQAAVLASCERAFGSASLKGRSVAVVGLGSVGLRLARLLARRGASLVVSDIDERKRADADKLAARWLAPDRALVAEVDVLAPCALGGVLNDETVPLLRCRVVAGAANNQLGAAEDGDRIRAAGILYAPDYVVNAGGVIHLAGTETLGWDASTLAKRLEGIGDTLLEVFDSAERDDTSTAAAADRLAARRLAEERDA
jgi:leucine dehydrogenase